MIDEYGHEWVLTEYTQDFKFAVFKHENLFVCKNCGSEKVERKDHKSYILLVDGVEIFYRTSKDQPRCERIIMKFALE